ncbi:hypothetical protein L0Z72_10615, partial [candidate division KSB1 bacterium]|nr:hypothetical protein [candidate division KSB1 bacterium]
PIIVDQASDSQNGFSEKLFHIINDHRAQGIKLTEIGKMVDAKWQTLIPFAKSLMEQGKITKKDNLYFPV